MTLAETIHQTWGISKNCLIFEPLQEMNYWKNIYISKTSQNELLFCLKTFIQEKIVEEVRSQQVGPYYGFQCDEVTDASNWEQLGLFIRYVTNDKPTERLLESIDCEEVTGEAICDSIIIRLNEIGLYPNYCRSQTMDGEANMAGKYSGVAATFTEQYPLTVYHYCSSHDLNLALCKSCSIKEVQFNMSWHIKKAGDIFQILTKANKKTRKSHRWS